MFLAGRQAVAPSRRAKVWPVLAAASWLSCAAVVAVLAARPAKVVTEVRVVERVVEVPAEVPREGPRRKTESRTVAEVRQVPSVASAPGFTAVGLGGRPWTLLSSRAEIDLESGPVAVAEAGPRGVAPTPARAATSYGDLRKELLPGRSVEPIGAGVLRWF